MPQNTEKIKDTEFTSKEFRNSVMRPLFAEPESKRKFAKFDHGSQTLVDDPVKLPNKIDLQKLKRLLMYSDRYEISVQFWPDQIAVYIEKDSVELTSFGGSFNHAVVSGIKYLDRINRKK